MVNTQLNLKFLQRLLVASRCKVVYIRIGYVIRFTKKAIRAAIHNLLRKVVEFQVGVPHHPGIQNMIVVSTAVESNKSEPHQVFNFRRCRINHTNYRFTFTFNLPVNQEKVRKDLHIIEHEFCIVILGTVRSLFRLELHLVY